MPPWAPYAIMAGSQLAGSALGFMGQQDTNAANAAATHEANIINRANADRANATQIDEFNQNIALQKDFAQNGISWRIADAAKNGISPLAALGASGPSFSPVSAVMQEPAWQTPQYTSPLSPAASGIPELGQNLSRALMSSMDPIAKKASLIDLDMKQSSADLLEVQLANARLELAQRTAGAASPGIPKSYRVLQNADGSTSLYPIEGINTHNTLFGPTEWSLRNKLFLSPNINKPLWSQDSSGHWRIQ